MQWPAIRVIMLHQASSRHIRGCMVTKEQISAVRTSIRVLHQHDRLFYTLRRSPVLQIGDQLFPRSRAASFQPSDSPNESIHQKQLVLLPHVLLADPKTRTAIAEQTATQRAFHDACKKEPDNADLHAEFLAYLNSISKSR